MVAASRSLGLLAVSGFVLQSIGARISRKHSDPETKFIAGVPVLNYHLAYQGGANLAELGENAKVNWVVVAKPGTSDTKIQVACLQHGPGCALAGHPSSGGVPFFKIHGTEEELKTVLQAVGGHAQFAEPDSLIESLPDMPSIQSTGSWGLDRVGVPEASRTGRGVHVYVTDTGIRVSHRDFGGRAIPSLDLISGSVRECNGNRNCAQDTRGHGTHCAGTVGGTTFGVAPRAKLYAVKVLGRPSDGKGEWSWTYSALDWLATKGLRPAVASMSLGAQATQNAMKVAVDYAVNSGVTVVVAGGNDNSDSCGHSPAFVPSAITVGSIDPSNKRSDFSNYGRCTDIWAPGRDIVSADYRSDTGTQTMSGTSMACPHVSGGAALLLEANSGLRSSQIISQMLSTARRGVISGLTRSDHNELLWVGASGPSPSPSPPPSPPPADDNCPHTWCPAQCFYVPCKVCNACKR